MAVDALGPAWPELGPPQGLYPQAPAALGQAVIGVVRDAAFGFYYSENLQALQNHGARLVFCSALEDVGLPPGLGALYIGGGFPETHAQRLADNQGFRQAIRRAAESGLPVYAECGGLMYLGRYLKVQGHAYPMAGVFPLDFAMQNKPQGHGYTLCRVVQANPFLSLGLEFKAHEFHYSLPQALKGAEYSFAYQVIRGQGILGDGGGLLLNNVLGTYHHVHAMGLNHWAPGLVAAARRRPEGA